MPFLLFSLFDADLKLLSDINACVVSLLSCRRHGLFSKVASRRVLVLPFNVLVIVA